MKFQIRLGVTESSTHLEVDLNDPNPKIGHILAAVKDFVSKATPFIDPDRLYLANPEGPVRLEADHDVSDYGLVDSDLLLLCVEPGQQKKQ